MANIEQRIGNMNKFMEKQGSDLSSHKSGSKSEIAALGAEKKALEEKMTAVEKKMEDLTNQLGDVHLKLVAPEMTKPPEDEAKKSAEKPPPPEEAPPPPQPVEKNSPEKPEKPDLPPASPIYPKVTPFSSAQMPDSFYQPNFNQGFPQGPPRRGQGSYPESHYSMDMPHDQYGGSRGPPPNFRGDPGMHGGYSGGGPPQFGRPRPRAPQQFDPGMQPPFGGPPGMPPHGSRRSGMPPPPVHVMQDPFDQYQPPYSDASRGSDPNDYYHLRG